MERKEKQGGHVQAFKIGDWPEIVEKQWQAKRKRNEIRLEAYNWQFDGAFQKKSHTLSNYLPRNAQTIEITSLKYYPLRFSPELKLALLERGRKFWDCRLRNFIVYNGWDYNYDQNIVSIPPRLD